MVLPGCWILVAGYWMLVAGCWMLDTGCWILVAGKRIMRLDTFYLPESNIADLCYLSSVF